MQNKPAKPVKNFGLFPDAYCSQGFKSGPEQLDSEAPNVAVATSNNSVSSHILKYSASETKKNLQVELDASTWSPP